MKFRDALRQTFSKRFSQQKATKLKDDNHRNIGHEEEVVNDFRHNHRNVDIKEGVVNDLRLKELKEQRVGSDVVRQELSEKLLSRKLGFEMIESGGSHGLPRNPERRIQQRICNRHLGRERNFKRRVRRHCSRERQDGVNVDRIEKEIRRPRQDGGNVDRNGQEVRREGGRNDFRNCDRVKGSAEMITISSDELRTLHRGHSADMNTIHYRRSRDMNTKSRVPVQPPRVRLKNNEQVDFSEFSAMVKHVPLPKKAVYKTRRKVVEDSDNENDECTNIGNSDNNALTIDLKELRISVKDGGEVESGSVDQGPRKETLDKATSPTCSDIYGNDESDSSFNFSSLLVNKQREVNNVSETVDLNDKKVSHDITSKATISDKKVSQDVSSEATINSTSPDSETDDKSGKTNTKPIHSTSQGLRPLTSNVEVTQNGTSPRPKSQTVSGSAVTQNAISPKSEISSVSEVTKNGTSLRSEDVVNDSSTLPSDIVTNLSNFEPSCYDNPWILQSDLDTGKVNAKVRDTQHFCTVELINTKPLNWIKADVYPCDTHDTSLGFEVNHTDETDQVATNVVNGSEVTEEHSGLVPNALSRYNSNDSLNSFGSSVHSVHSAANELFFSDSEAEHDDEHFTNSFNSAEKPPKQLIPYALSEKLTGHDSPTGITQRRNRKFKSRSIEEKVNEIANHVFHFIDGKKIEEDTASVSSKSSKKSNFSLKKSLSVDDSCESDYDEVRDIIYEKKWLGFNRRSLDSSLGNKDNAKGGDGATMKHLSMLCSSTELLLAPVLEAEGKVSRGLTQNGSNAHTTGDSDQTYFTLPNPKKRKTSQPQRKISRLGSISKIFTDKAHSLSNLKLSSSFKLRNEKSSEPSTSSSERVWPQLSLSANSLANMVVKKASNISGMIKRRSSAAADFESPFKQFTKKKVAKPVIADEDKTELVYEKVIVKVPRKRKVTHQERRAAEKKLKLKLDLDMSNGYGSPSYEMLMKHTASSPMVYRSGLIPGQLQSPTLFDEIMQSVDRARLDRYNYPAGGDEAFDESECGSSNGSSLFLFQKRYSLESDISERPSRDSLLMTVCRVCGKVKSTSDDSMESTDADEIAKVTANRQAVSLCDLTAICHCYKRRKTASRENHNHMNKFLAVPNEPLFINAKNGCIRRCREHCQSLDNLSMNKRLKRLSISLTSLDVDDSQIVTDPAVESPKLFHVTPGSLARHQPIFNLSMDNLDKKSLESETDSAHDRSFEFRDAQAVTLDEHGQVVKDEEVDFDSDEKELFHSCTDVSAGQPRVLVHRAVLQERRVSLKAASCGNLLEPESIIVMDQLKLKQMCRKEMRKIKVKSLSSSHDVLNTVAPVENIDLDDNIMDSDSDPFPASPKRKSPPEAKFENTKQESDPEKITVTKLSAETEDKVEHIDMENHTSKKTEICDIEQSDKGQENGFKAESNDEKVTEYSTDQQTWTKFENGDVELARESPQTETPTKGDCNIETDGNSKTNETTIIGKSVDAVQLRQFKARDAFARVMHELKSFKEDDTGNLKVNGEKTELTPAVQIQLNERKINDRNGITAAETILPSKVKATKFTVRLEKMESAPNIYDRNGSKGLRRNSQRRGSRANSSCDMCVESASQLGLKTTKSLVTCKPPLPFQKKHRRFISLCDINSRDKLEGDVDSPSKIVIEKYKRFSMSGTDSFDMDSTESKSEVIKDTSSNYKPSVSTTSGEKRRKAVTDDAETTTELNALKSRFLFDEKNITHFKSVKHTRTSSLRHKSSSSDGLSAKARHRSVTEFDGEQLYSTTSLNKLSRLYTDSWADDVFHNLSIPVNISTDPYHQTSASPLSYDNCDGSSPFSTPTRESIRYSKWERLPPLDIDSPLSEESVYNYDVCLGYLLHSVQCDNTTICVYSLQRNKQFMESVIAPLSTVPGSPQKPGQTGSLNKSKAASKVRTEEAPNPAAPITQVPSVRLAHAGHVLRTVLLARAPHMIRDRKFHLRTYRRCMVGTEMVDWLLQQSTLVHSRTQAVGMWQALVEEGVVVHVCHEHQFKDKYLFYRFHEDDEGVSTVPSTATKRECEDDLADIFLMLAHIGPDAMMRMILRKPSHERTSEDLEIIYEELLHIKALSHLSTMVKRELASVLVFESHAKAGTVLFNQGDEGKSWYIILKGSVNVVIYGKGVVCTLHEGDDFGKLALVNDAPRAATIVLRDDNCHFLRVDKDDFNRILRDVEANTVRLKEHGQDVLVLEKIPTNTQQPDGTVQAHYKYSVMAGTPDKMLEHLLEGRLDNRNETQIDGFLEDFLLTHVIFMPYNHLCPVLLSHYHSSTADGSEQEGADFMINHKKCVLHFVQEWANIVGAPFKQDHTINAFLEELLSCVTDDLEDYPTLKDDLTALETILHAETGSTNNKLKKRSSGTFLLSKKHSKECFQDLPKLRKTIKPQDETLFKVYCADHSYTTLKLPMDTRVEQLLACAIEKLGLGEDLVLCEVKSTGERVVFKENDLCVTTGLSINGRLFVTPKEHLDALTTLSEQEGPGESSFSTIEMFSSREMAYQMTMWDWELFTYVQEYELIYQVFGRSKFGKITANLDVFLRRFNEIQFWVATEMVLTTNLSKRVSLLRKFIKLAAHCKEFQNLNSFFAVVMGLSNIAVSRLSQTWEKLPGKFKKMFADFETLMDPSRNHRVYRLSVAKMSPPILPFMPLLMKDMTFTHEGNKTYFDCLINFEKMHMIAQTLKTIQFCRSAPLDVEAPNTMKSSEISEYIRDIHVIDNQRLLTQLSHKLEPRKT